MSTSRDASLPRRTFLGTVGASLALACSNSSTTPPPAVATAPTPSAPTPPAPQPTTPPAQGSIPRRTLGRTGEQVSIIGLGGYHLGIPKDEQEATRIIRTALDRGLNFLDNCWDYHDGKSEERMGRALLDGYRAKAFLMTKIDGRTKQAATEQLEQSLRRLQTDRIDLVQIHEIIRMEDPERVFRDGCVQALLDAKKAGKLRYIGFTGHKDPDIHLAMIQSAEKHGFAFDTVQMPINVLDAHYRSFGQKVVPVAVQKNLGVLGMKPMAAGKIVEDGVASATECLRYALSMPTSVVITGCDSLRILEQALEVASTFKPMTSEEVAALLDRTRKVAADGKLEEFKTSQKHDGTTTHPHWLESARL